MQCTSLISLLFTAVTVEKKQRRLIDYLRVGLGSGQETPSAVSRRERIIERVPSLPLPPPQVKYTFNVLAGWINC